MKREFDPPLCQHSFASRYNPDFSACLASCSCQLPLPTRQLLTWLVLFQSFVNDKDEIFFTIAMKIQISLSARLVKHLPHQPNQSKSNLSRQAPLFQQEADEKVIPQQANQTLWLFHIRQDQTLLLFFVAVPSVIPQCIESQCCNTEDGKWKYSLTHYPTTTTNKYPLVRFRCINVKMTREFG